MNRIVYYGGNDYRDYLVHHGIRGQKWGVRNGPPYPLPDKINARVRMSAKYREGHAEIGSYIVNRLGSSKKAKEFQGSFNINDLPRLNKAADVDEALKRINHDDSNSIGRHFNCQNCAVAFELVKRGYDIQAQPRSDLSNVGDITEVFAGHPDLVRVTDAVKIKPPEYQKTMSWREMDREVANRCLTDRDKKVLLDDEGYLKYSLSDPPNVEMLLHLGKIKKCDDALDALRKEQFAIREANRKKCSDYKDKVVPAMENMLKKQGNGARGIIVTNWSDEYNLDRQSSCFHAFNYEIENGSVRYCDTQSRGGYNNYGSDWIGDSDFRGVHFIRTDNLDFSEKVTDYVYPKK